ncbi:MAG: NAD(P)/FAD-dependent oxidoreductase [Deltaproteobacteria bacterium]
MRVRVGNLPLWLDETDERLRARAAERLGVSPQKLGAVRVVKRSLDARKKGHPRHLMTVEVELPDDVRLGQVDESVQPVAEDPAPPPHVTRSHRRPIVVGAGPAGLFAALGLLERGIRCVLIDRGRAVGPRRVDVAKLFRAGELDTESNMNFGEGGAGAYTDGKLGTRIGHPAVRKVVETFAHYGESKGLDRILVEGKPHVGSDVLPCAVEGLREHLVANGVEVRWQTRVVDLLVDQAGRCQGVGLADGQALESDRVILAPGNSGRELFQLFAERGWGVSAKPFAVGFRVEHPQALIDEIQYGSSAGHPKLPPADYKLAENPRLDGETPRGVFSFCMCPGGIVVPTPTEPGLQCTNGMSNSHRSARYANAGLVVAVSPADYAKEGFTGPLAGLEWQRKWERAAYELGGGGYRAPAMRLTDYLAGSPRAALGATTYRPALLLADLTRLFPEVVHRGLAMALRGFERKMHGFITSEAVLIGVESRTSSPVRIERGERLQSVAVPGLYPCGEGAGYAGGIVSSAVDGLKIAEAIGQELA